MIIECSERVGGSRIGADGKLRLVSALDLVQDCECVGVESDKEFWGWFETNNMAMFLASRGVVIKRMPEYRETLTVRTMPYAASPSLGYRYTEIVDSDGGLCVSCYSTAAYVDLALGRSARVPKEVLASVELHGLPSPPPGARRVNVTGERVGTVTPIPVRLNDIDLNNHMNNVKYVESALELITRRDLASLRVEYKSPAKFGDTLYTELFTNGEAAYARMADADGKIFAVLEFCYAR
ncbi:MAG: hypothetical protein LBN43_00025 [Oscillospiraceae bacterium]|jgi:acyl-ACP thioesterase|nr:hypothetical protein [Oscillospiraceae bacterium]